MATIRTGDSRAKPEAGKLAAAREGTGWAILGFLTVSLFVGIYLLAGMTRTEPARAGTVSGAAPHPAAAVDTKAGAPAHRV